MTDLETPRPYDALRRIVAAIDYFRPSEIALTAALEDARQSHGVLNVLHVVEAEAVEHPATAAEALDGLRRYVAPRLFQRAEVHRLETPITAICHVRGGDPAHEIAQATSDLDADVLYVATHGRRRGRETVLGSVAERVVRRASCPVVVMRHKGDPQDDWVRSIDTARNREPRIEPRCPRCLAERTRTDGAELWCEEHRRHHGRRHVYHFVPRTGKVHVNPPLVFSENPRVG